MTTTPAHAHTHSCAFAPLLNTWLPRRRQSIFATAATLYLYSSKTTTVVVVVLWLSPPFHSLSSYLSPSRHSRTRPIPLFFIVTIFHIYLSFSLLPLSHTPLYLSLTLSFSREIYVCNP